MRGRPGPALVHVGGAFRLNACVGSGSVSGNSADVTFRRDVHTDFSRRPDAPVVRRQGLSVTPAVPLPLDHPERLALADEVHTRPSAQLPTPCCITYLAVLLAADERAAEQAHLHRLCERFGGSSPTPSMTHFSVPLATPAGTLQLKWERHGEFSSWTFFVEGGPAAGVEPGAAFDSPAAARLPSDWLPALPGRVLVAANVLLLPAAPGVPVEADLARWFGSNVVVGSEVADAAALVFTDFRVHADGFSRFLLLSRRLSPRRAGRVVQRLCEIEAYRMMSLLALPLARQQSPALAAIEKALAQLTDDIAREEGDDEKLLHELTRLAAGVERIVLASQFRFGACRAYADLVRTRIAELRETRLSGLQTLGEFMARRFEPAVATCLTMSSRLHDLSERVAQASGLLSTRVSIARERQNQALLSSMDRRAKTQLRLQQTVEGLSVAAIVYYVVGLVGYIGKGLRAGGVDLNADLAMGVAVPAVAMVMVMALRHARKRIHADEE